MKEKVKHTEKKQKEAAGSHEVFDDCDTFELPL